MNPSGISPVNTANRIVILDVLRGWALLGVVIMNYVGFYYFGTSKTGNSDLLTKILSGINGLIFSSKSWTMLSVLFGYGFSLLMKNVAEKNHNTYRFFGLRMFWLFVIGVLNSSFYYGDILKDYAILGLFLLIFYRTSARALFIICLILFLAIPAVSSFVKMMPDTGKTDLKSLYPFYQSSNIWDVLWFGLKGTYVAQVISKPYLYTVHLVMMCCFMLGISLHKVDFLTNLHQKKKQLKQILWVTLVFFFLVGIISAFSNGLKWPLIKYYNMGFWIVLNSMLLIAISIILLFESGKMRRFFSWMELMGKMTLTNYFVQNILGLVLFSGFGFNIFNTYPLVFYVSAAVLVYVLQILFSKWWLSKYNYGPVEWIWRQLSYMRKLPLKKDGFR